MEGTGGCKNMLGSPDALPSMEFPAKPVVVSAYIFRRATGLFRRRESCSWAILNFHIDDLPGPGVVCVGTVFGAFLAELIGVVITG